MSRQLFAGPPLFWHHRPTQRCMHVRTCPCTWSAGIIHTSNALRYHMQLQPFRRSIRRSPSAYKASNCLTSIYIKKSSSRTKPTCTWCSIAGWCFVHVRVCCGFVFQYMRITLHLRRRTSTQCAMHVMHQIEHTLDCVSEHTHTHNIYELKSVRVSYFISAHYRPSPVCGFGE